MVAYAVANVDFVSARYTPDQLVLAGPGRRLVAAAFDSLLASLPLFLLFMSLFASFFSFSLGTFLYVVSWALLLGGFIWYIVAATKGQSPGKQIARMYVLCGDGTRAGFWYVIMRELVVKQWLIFTVGSFITGGILPVVAALWCLWDPNKQCLWDKIVSTYVAYSPLGYIPPSANELRQQGRPIPGTRQMPEPAVPNIVIHNNAQVGSNWGSNVAGSAPVAPSRPASTGGRISVLEGGRQTANVMVAIGEVALIGREAQARVHVSDAGASRRHAEITFDGSTWTIRDLGSLNPTQVIEPSGRRRQLNGQDRLPYGQLAIGESVVTLYPASRG